MTAGTIAAILAPLLAGVFLVALGLWRRFGGGAEPVVAPGAGSAAGSTVGAAVGPAGGEGVAQVAEEVAARVEGLLSAQRQAQADALADLKAEILGLKSDVEWLAGERMIEQAIAMAQTGVEAEEIGRELGLSRDAAETIVAFRRH